MEKNSALILIGIKHCGKSSVGKILSERLSVPFYDTDSVICKMTGKTPREIFAQNGEDAFKKAEQDACKKIVAELGEKKSAVIATGGGICNNKIALEELKSLGKFLFLFVNEETAFSRIAKEISVQDGKLCNLPAFIAKKNPQNMQDVRLIFHEFYEERTKLYKKIADIHVSVGNSSVQQNAERILALIH